MKKIYLGCLLLILPLICFGCQKAEVNVVRDNMSEMTNLYFMGANNTDRASISVGFRENPYMLDGIHQNTCDFSLIILNLQSQRTENTLNATISVNGKNTAIVMDLHPISHAYMYDLGYQLKAEDSISLSYDGTVLQLYNASKDFKIDSEEALKIGSDTLQAHVKGYHTGNGFLAECYLSVLGEVSGEFKDLFWSFTIEGRDRKTYSCVISVEDGTVLAANA